MSQINSLDLELVGHLLYGSAERLVKFKLPNGMIDHRYQDVIDYIHKFFKEHKQIPTPDTIYKAFGLMVPQPPGDYEYLLEQIQERAIHSTSSRELTDIAKLLNNKEYDKLISKLEQLPKSLRGFRLEKTNVQDLFSREHNKSALDQYLDRKTGQMGVEIPWPTLTKITWGWQPGDLALIGARAGQGKTWFMLHMAHHAWKHKRKVLFVSPEMARITLVNRFASIELKLNYERIRTGRLDSAQEKMYAEFIYDKGRAFSDRIFIFSDEFEMKIEALDAAIQDIQPDVVFIDGVYLLRTDKEKDRMKRAPIIADELKQKAKKHGIPFICSTQLTREAIKLKVADIHQGHFVLSDAFNWNSDWVLCLGRDAGHKEKKQMVLKPLKTREGDFQREILLNWDFMTFDFSEFAEDESKSFGKYVNNDIPF